MSKREKRVVVTMTPEDLEIIKRAAQAEGRSVSSFLRQSGLEKAKHPATDGVQGLANAFISRMQREEE